MEGKKRANFGSKLGAILAVAGSAVGLGNIWRFPTETGSNGGGAFILVYLLCILIICLPVMIAEFLIGRHSHANTARAFRILSPRSNWVWLGRLCVLSAFLILCYYNVVAGWTLNYTVTSLVNGFSRMSASGNSEVFRVYFNNFMTNPWQQVIFFCLFMMMTHLVIVRGVEKGIERFSKIFMPVLFILLIILMICSLTMSGAAKGLDFLFHPDFSKITSGTVLAAMGQAFFSLSIGMGCLCTYASYFRPKDHLAKSAATVCLIDTMVAVMAGIVIFPAVFSVSGVSPDEGPALIFITLPNIFQTVFNGLPVLSYLFSAMFYFLLVLATLTSTISLHEVVTAYLSEEYKLSRKRAARYVTLGCTVLGIFCALSLGVLNGLTAFGLSIFDLFDFVTAKLMLPVAGFFISILAGWFLSRNVIEQELTNNGTDKFPFLPMLVFSLKYIVPLGIAFIFIDQLGFFK